MTVLGGTSESALGGFIRDQGISKQLESALIIPEVRDEQTCKDNEGSTPSIQSLFSIRSILIKTSQIYSPSQLQIVQHPILY